MAVTYFKRFRMEVSLVGREFVPGPLPAGYRWHKWGRGSIDAHADVKYRSFRGEIDASVFPCLGEADGCRRLMTEISRKRGFLPAASWLLSWQCEPGEPLEYCGTIQGIRDRSGYGAIQNLGVTAGHRGQGFGTLLMLKALHGFQAAGLRRAFLEVTAQNEGAIRLYERLGFKRVRTVYKAVELNYGAVRV